MTANIRREWYENLSLSGYDKPSSPVKILILKNGYGGFHHPREQYVLRMLVRRPDGPVMLPLELGWLSWPIRVAAARQQALGLDLGRFVYVTVRIGEVRSQTDDIWHVDGFSMRTPHVPEQNYVWADHTPTEFLDKAIPIPAGFDPMVHNLHSYFQEHADVADIRTMESGCMTMIDPYCIHRRPPSLNADVMRAFFRISFIPIEVEDDSCTPNPMLPAGPFNREDIRKSLISFRDPNL